MTATIRSLHFAIEHNGRKYRCDPIRRGPSVVYRVHLPESRLYLVRSISAQGKPFWTSIPEDLSTIDLVKELGAIIERQWQYNQN
jgi:hypothetical protein